MTAIPACLRAADTARLTRTSVLLPMTVARAEEYVAVAGVLELMPLVAAVLLPGVFLPMPLVAAVLLLEVPPLLEPPPQAATTSPAATITAMADSREQLCSKRISFP